MQPLIEELTAPGNEIIVQPPVHHVFAELIAASGRVAVANPLRRSGTTYVMDYVDLAAKISPRTKLLVLCNPHNPVARVWTRDELAQVQQICAQHGIVVVTDAVYCGLIYPGVTYTPYASRSHDASWGSATLMLASKSFNVTGLKHSLLIAENPRLRAAFAQCDHWSAAVVD